MPTHKSVNFHTLGHTNNAEIGQQHLMVSLAHHSLVELANPAQQALVHLVSLMAMT
ncbi:hypothetical protein [Teredinibacter purpureus]|uniref:hypothetical protein n=1 Tax=Teredinibacter purpureus TaxID=2731756 RepID=UPI0013C4645F|nr:hypothetical protein [Teredinibacter purpureus]